MKIDELVVLEKDELGDRLKTARRELYELRFKHAVGQLENTSQISRVRKDIAKIFTVLRQRDFGVAAVVAEPAAEAVAAPAAKAAAKPEGEAKPKRARAKKTETKEDA